MGHVHKLCRSERRALLNKKQRVKDDGFRKGDGQNRLHENRCRCAGIAADRGGGAHSDETDADGGTESREADVNFSSDFCEDW